MGREVALRVPGLYPHQQLHNDAPQRFKLGRWGRRAGKTIWIFRAAVMGHGPTLADGTPMHKGLIHGKDVVWVGRSKDQARTIWNNEVRPRFEATGIGSLNDTLFTASLGIPKFGKLIVKSQDKDSINNVRGMGDTIGGVVGDEVAHWDDAESAWLDVLLPVLTDNLSWFAGVSTTEPGSWFNRQCANIMSGVASPNTWFHTHFTAKNNPRISSVAFEQLVAEYTPGDPRLAKEVYAELTIGGAGHALTIRESDVMISPLNPGTLRQRNVTFFGSVDWGYAHPYSFGLYMVEGDGLVTRIDGVQNIGRNPIQQAEEVRGLLGRYGLTFRDLDYTVAGGDVFADKGRSVGMKGVTISEQWGKMGWYVRRGDTRRVAGLSNVRTYLHENLFRVAATQNGLWFLGQLQDRVMDERHPEDARKDDARSDGTGGDDGYDECLAPDTPILTRNGWEKIGDLVGTTGEVYSHHGWRRYEDVRMTSPSRPIVRVTLEGGWSVRMTANHPVLTPSGWVNAGDLKPDDTWIRLLPHVGYISASPTGAENGRDSGVERAEVPEECAGVLAVWPEVPASRDMALVGGGNTRWVACASPQCRQVGQQDRESGVSVWVGARGQASSGDVGCDEGQAASARAEDSGCGSAVPSLTGGCGHALADCTGDMAQPGVQDAGVPALSQVVSNQSDGQGEVLRGGLPDRGPSWCPVPDGGRVVRNMRFRIPVSPRTVAPVNDVLPIVPWGAGRVASVREDGESPVYNLEVEGAHSYIVHGGFVVHNCKIALLSRARIPSASDEPKLGDDPLREIAWKAQTGDISEPEWNSDGTPCYIPPVTYEEY